MLLPLCDHFPAFLLLLVQSCCPCPAIVGCLESTAHNSTNKPSNEIDIMFEIKSIDPVTELMRGLFERIRVHTPPDLTSSDPADDSASLACT